METWQKVWREGFVPEISTIGLEGLRVALIDDNPRLIQGCTTEPPPLKYVSDRPCKGGCAASYCGFAEHYSTHGTPPSVREVEEYFGRLCFKADKRLGDAGACRHFLIWFDDTPREEMREKLLEEVEMELENRKNRI